MAVSELEKKADKIIRKTSMPSRLPVEASFNAERPFLDSADHVEALCPSEQLIPHIEQPRLIKFCYWCLAQLARTSLYA
jgi:hypothetical protein